VAGEGREGQPRLLVLSLEDVLTGERDARAEADYPDSLVLHGTTVPARAISSIHAPTTTA
jgi:hypothetical protein